MATGFTVTSVNQASVLGATGRLEDVVTITFELADGLGSGEVSVPLTADWQAVAEALVIERATAMRALLAL